METDLLMEEDPLEEELLSHLQLHLEIHLDGIWLDQLVFFQGKVLVTMGEVQLWQK